jgi:gluconokinase
MNYVLSIDVGTSSVRASLYDEEGEAVPEIFSHQSHAPVSTPDGGAEMDAEALFQRTLACVEQVLARAGDRARRIAGVGVCTFWHSILGVDADRRAVTPVLLWADTRSVGEVEALKHALDERALHARTGCMLHTSYVAPRLLWAARNRPEWLSAARGWMSPGEYFFTRLFGRSACGVSMASGTGMYHQAAERWDEELLQALPVRAEQLNEVVDTLTPFTGLTDEFARRLPALAGVPWFPAAGDGACSNVGSGCAAPERVALMVGTSGALRVMAKAEGGRMKEERGQAERGKAEGGKAGAADPGNLHPSSLLPPPSEEPVPPWGLWKYRLDRGRYLLGGALSNGGNLFAWLRDSLRAPEGEELERALLRMEPDSHGLTVLPFLAGERCPGWRGEARAAIVGLSWSTKPVEIMRAGLESVAYRFALVHELLGGVLVPDRQIVASGGALLASPAWTQILADALGEKVVLSEEEEATARGAALLALEGAGLIPTVSGLPARPGRMFTPDPERHARYREARLRQQRLYEALIVQDWKS